MKPWSCVLRAPNLCPATACMCRWTYWNIHPILVERTHKGKVKENYKHPIVIIRNCLFECNFYPSFTNLKMVIWVGSIILKLTFIHKKLYASFHSFKSFFNKFWNSISEGSLEVWRFTDLGKLQTLMQTEFFQFLSKFCTTLWNK